MFNSDIGRRLNRLEANQTNATNREIAVQKLESEVSAQIRNMFSMLSSHIERQEKIMDENNESLKVIVEKLNTMDREIVSHTKDVELKIVTSTEGLKDAADEKYATKIEVNSGFNAIRKQAKLIWICATVGGSVVSAAVLGSIWLMGKLGQ